VAKSLQGIEKIHLSVSRPESWLVADFSEIYDTLSWAVLGGDMPASSVVWLKVTSCDLSPGIDPAIYLKHRIENELKRSGAVGLLTSANLDDYADVQKSHGEFEARCIATVGLSNAVRIGDPPTAHHIGTINLLCVFSHPLSYESRLEALSLAAEARTAAVLEAAIPSTVSTFPATGTGTDCIVIASPQGGNDVKYAGKHTIPGSVIGSAVYEAVRTGTASWFLRNKK